MPKAAFFFALSLISSAIPAPAATISGQVTAEDFPGGLPGVNVVVYQDSLATGMGAATDPAGLFVIPAIPAGKYQIHFEYLGYKTEIREILLAPDSEVKLSVKLSLEALPGQEMEVTASVARHEVVISNTPLRVEVMVPEELQDKIAFSSSVNGALRYSGGITVNTSRNLYEAENVHLRGVDSRYLLLLNDQAPVLGYQPEAVGIWTLPLVGLKQIEIVKGDHSALYGLGQAGVINSVLRTPFTDSLAFFGLARSNFQDDHYAGLYAGKKSHNWGASGIFSGEQLAQDDTSENRRYVILPRMDYRSGEVRAFLSGTALGIIYGSNRSLLERQGLSAGLAAPIADQTRIQFQAQLADQRESYLPDPASMQAHSRLDYLSTHLEHNARSLTSIAGLDGYWENWNMLENYSGTHSKIERMGVFLQEEWTINEHWAALYGGRISHVWRQSGGPFAYQMPSAAPDIGNSSNTATVSSQFLSFLWKPGYLISYRLSGSYGTTAPLSHYLQQEGDTLRLFVPSAPLKLERFWSADFDLRWMTHLGTWPWTNDLSLFMTTIEDHFDVYASPAQIGLANGSRYALPGAEFFSRLDLGSEAALLLGYTLLYPNDAYETSPGTMLPLPRHQGNFELDWEIEPTGLRVEIEGKFVSGQKTPGNLWRSSAPPYAVFGTTLEYALGPAKLFAGAENLADFRQEDQGPLWGPRTGREIYLGLKAWW